MRGKSLKKGLRPVDLAREHGLSTQAVRNYEEAGFLPPAERSPNGYRAYTQLHAAALRTFLALIPGHGHATAGAVMRAVHRGREEEALRLIDGSHALLAEDRRTLESVALALGDLALGDRVSGDPAPGDPGPVSVEEVRGTDGLLIGHLAHRLGLRPATLRKWEAAGLVVPERDRRTGYRVYRPGQVRDALLVRQLRRGGHGLERIGLVLEQVRTAGGAEPLQAALAEWSARLTARGRALLAGAAALHAYLELPEDGAATGSAP
ncbi:MerR family DNA-binding transcriptional regulator [Kitasatospora sp. NPDC096147]|uniref:MerR family transcriptional regulator n=1 Tax=Kitasatospora sp. NPDC096147 TaxID=3364093 RepID=UPI00382BE828